MDYNSGITELYQPSHGVKITINKESLQTCLSDEAKTCACLAWLSSSLAESRS